MSDPSGHTEMWKKEEDKKKKEELFKENPDNFIHKQDIIVGIVRTEKGPAMCFNIKTRDEMMRSFGEIQVALIGQAIKQGIMSDVSKIVKPGVGGGIINFARRRR